MKSRSEGEEGSAIRFTSGDAGFALLLALASTAIAYRFGVGNQHDQIPIVLRQIDPAYLTRDFFTTSSIEFGPRIYFATLIKWICLVLPLPWAYIALTFLSDLALIAVTQWAARWIVGADRLGSMMTTVLVMCVSGFHLGDATQLRYEHLFPASLAIPGMLLSVALGLRGRAAAAAAAAAVSSLMHPLYGVEGGAMALVTAFFALLVRAPGSSEHAGEEIRPPNWRHALTQTSIGGAILGLSVLVFWWWPYQGTREIGISSGELIEILSFRAPHHYLPSQFRPQDYLFAGLFVLASSMAFGAWKRTVSSARAGLLILPIVGVASACVAGILFVEIWPTRLIFTLQPFRLLSIVKWLGYLLLGWLFASCWRGKRDPLARSVVGLSLLSAGAAFSLITPAGLSLLWLRRRLAWMFNPYLWIPIMTAGTVFIWTQSGSVEERVKLIFSLALIAVFQLSSSRLRTTAVAGAIGIVVLVAGTGRVRMPDPIARIQPVFDLASLQDIDAQTARQAARVTASDAVFVVPPDFGVLRFIGRRALVVDFKAIPFQDRQMQEWRERIRTVYGDVEGGGYPALAALDTSYRSISDMHLQELARIYGATHAVLYSETRTRLPDLYSNDTYRVVALMAE